MASKIMITEKPIDIGEFTEFVGNEKAGGIASFLGVTRNYNGDRKVVSLFYEAYESMAIKQMEQVYQEAKEKFPIFHMAIVHRVGMVFVKEPSVFIVVSAGHRKEAFDACRFAIDRLKAIVPIWKREIFDNQETEWIANGESIGTKL